MGRAAELLGVTAAFLRGLDSVDLLTPQRSDGGHRRYSRYQLRLAARVRELVDTGTTLESAARIVVLEDQLAQAHALNAELSERHSPSPEHDS
ncbi:MerR family DNA-binding transcriptional regulator [Nocardia brasiliensis]|nr:MerR family DNA-binding transcriptional regulator [Nocardia brasiliensis]